MNNNYGRVLSRWIKKGLKIVSITALGGLVAICSPQAAFRVSAAEPVRFSTYLMVDENGEFATDSHGEYIQLFDEKGNLLAGNDDVKDFLKSNSDKNGRKHLAAKEREFFLIDGKLYFDESGSNELTDLSQVMPAMFKYGTFDSGYTMESNSGTVYINPLDVNGNSVYVARIAGTYEKLPAFTISSGGDIGYLERGVVSNGDNEVAFVYDSNYFYDENLNQLTSMGLLVPEAANGNAPMFTGYYIKNGDDRRQFIDIDGSIVLSSEEYKDMGGMSAQVDAEYCYVLSFNAEGADSLTLYADINDGNLYNDYRKNEAFVNIGSNILWQLSYDEETNAQRGHYAGYYIPGDEGSFIRVIDESGNLIADSIGIPDSNKEYNARFYHTISADDSTVYISDGNIYSDPELLTQISNIAELTGGVPEDSEEEVHSDEKDMDGISRRYFIGYYFATDFGVDEDDEDAESEMLLSEYNEEDFDPANVDINKVKFADRNGNIVFDFANSPVVDGDMHVYQNWYTVTVWNDGEIEIEDVADENEEDVEVLDEEFEEDEDVEDTSEDEDESAEDESDEDKDKDEQNPSDGTIPKDGEENKDDQNSDKEGQNSGTNPAGDSSAVDEDAKPVDKEQELESVNNAGDDGDKPKGEGEGNTTEPANTSSTPSPVSKPASALETATTDETPES